MGRDLQLLAEHAGQWGVRLLGYCLMSNYLHPDRATSQSGVIRSPDRPRPLPLHARV
jgi:hypothetical protein